MDQAEFPHQILRTVKLMRCGRTSGDERLEHTSHHHSLHALGQRLITPCGEVVPKTSLVCKDKQTTLAKNCVENVIAGQNH